MTEQEHIEKIRENIIQCCLDTFYKFHRGYGEAVMDDILRKGIKALQEDTCTKQ